MLLVGEELRKSNHPIDCHNIYAMRYKDEGKYTEFHPSRHQDSLSKQGIEEIRESPFGETQELGKDIHAQHLGA